MRAKISYSPRVAGDEYQDARFRDIASRWDRPDVGDIAAVLLKEGANLDGATFLAPERCFDGVAPVEINGTLRVVGSPLARRTDDRVRLDLPRAQSIIRFHTRCFAGCGDPHENLGRFQVVPSRTFIWTGRTQATRAASTGASSIRAE